jgi:hypothetical protein
MNFIQRLLGAVAWVNPTALRAACTFPNRIGLYFKIMTAGESGFEKTEY